MNKHHFTTNEPNNGQLFNFMEYKQNKPYFMKPVKITIGNPINDTYYMLKNIVFNGKQILALRKEQEYSTIVLAEGKIKDGQLQYLSRLSDDSLRELRILLEGTI